MSSLSDFQMVWILNDGLKSGPKMSVFMVKMSGYQMDLELVSSWLLCSDSSMVSYSYGALNNGLICLLFRCPVTTGTWHLNNGPIEYWTSASLVLKCFRYSDVCYSDPHCSSAII